MSVKIKYCFANYFNVQSISAIEIEIWCDLILLSLNFYYSFIELRKKQVCISANLFLFNIVDFYCMINFLTARLPLLFIMFIK